MADFSFPKVSLDPSKIRDRWGLGAFGLVVWLIIAYVILTRPSFSLLMGFSVLILTFSLLVFLLMLSFARTEEPETARIPSPNIPPRPRRDAIEQNPTAQEITYLHNLVQLAQDPNIRTMLDEKFRKKR